MIANAYQTEDIGSICSFIDYAINKETNGRSLGLKMSDSVSGALTANLSTVHIEGETAKAQFDIRYPATVSGKKIIKQFKKVAKNMLQTLKAKALVLDWRKRQQTRAAVRLCIEEWLDKLPAVYTSAIYQNKYDAIYQHVYDVYGGGQFG